MFVINVCYIRMLQGASLGVLFLPRGSKASHKAYF